MGPHIMGQPFDQAVIRFAIGRIARSVKRLPGKVGLAVDHGFAKRKSGLIVGIAFL